MSKNPTPSAPRRKYDETFKTEAVRLITTGNRSVPDVAQSPGISENLLYNRIFAKAGVSDDPELASRVGDDPQLKVSFQRVEH